MRHTPAWYRLRAVSISGIVGEWHNGKTESATELGMSLVGASGHDVRVNLSNQGMCGNDIVVYRTLLTMTGLAFLKDLTLRLSLEDVLL